MSATKMLRAAVTAERSNNQYITNFKSVAKTQIEKETIYDALMENFFFRKLSREQIEKLVDAMSQEMVRKYFLTIWIKTVQTKEISNLIINF